MSEPATERLLLDLFMSAGIRC